MDTDARTDKVWLLNVQRKLYQWSQENPEGQSVCRRTVAANKGRRTPGIVRVTIKDIHRN